MITYGIYQLYYCNCCDISVWPTTISLLKLSWLWNTPSIKMINYLQTNTIIVIAININFSGLRYFLKYALAIYYYFITWNKQRLNVNFCILYISIPYLQKCVWRWSVPKKAFTSDILFYITINVFRQFPEFTTIIID